MINVSIWPRNVNAQVYVTKPAACVCMSVCDISTWAIVTWNGDTPLHLHYKIRGTLVQANWNSFPESLNSL